MQITFTATRPKTRRLVEVRASLWSFDSNSGLVPIRRLAATLIWPDRRTETHIVIEGRTRVRYMKRGRDQELDLDSTEYGFWYASSPVDSMDVWARQLAEYIRDRVAGVRVADAANETAEGSP